MPECLAEPPDFDTARAPLVYDAISAPLIRGLKFHDRYTGLKRAMAMMVAAHGTRTVDLIVPVPLHWRRLVMRRFNQSALLGFALSRAMGVPCLPQGLKRTRYTHHKCGWCAPSVLKMCATPLPCQTRQ